MTTIRCSVWALLGVALMFDLAPSCGGRRPGPPPPEPLDTSLTITASDCSCARGTLRVSVDNARVGDLKCGASNTLSITVSPGSHVVRAENGTAFWKPRSHDAHFRETTRVELGCPST